MVAESRFLEIIHRLRNRVSAIIFVAQRKRSESTRFLEIYTQAKKPGFCDYLGGAAKEIGINPVSGNYAVAKKPGFCDYLGGAAKEIGINPVSGNLCTG
ncbi:hypothetical protein QT970_26745 [Microcoleus sp. herbarium8]|uniref:hypothetical protein n=1 Tax=Microcoleus sp. herbarium8 TaxID=3055436 RepID=UPI002FCF7BCD